MQLEDEWNPHLVKDWSRKIEGAQKQVEVAISLCKKNLDKQLLEVYDVKNFKQLEEVRNTAINLDEQIQQYQSLCRKARKILRKHKREAWIPYLAYRIDHHSTVKLSADPILRPGFANKVGGIPDLTHYGSLYSKMLMHGIEPVKKNGHYPVFTDPRRTNVEKVLEQLWPTCGVCTKYMTPFGTFNLTKAMIPIILLQAPKEFDVDPWSPCFPFYKLHIKRNDYRSNYSLEDYISVLGQKFYSDLSSFAKDSLWNVFYCEHTNPEQATTAAVVVGDPHYDTYETRPHIPKERYFNEIQKFIIQHRIKIKKTIFELGEPRLKFDVDLPDDMPNDYKHPDTYDLKQDYPDVFGEECDYQFFGEPVSQQRPIRPFCRESTKLHRMTPIINAPLKPENTLQIYACLRCLPRENKCYRASGICDNSSS